MHKCLNTHMSIFYTVYCKNDRETTASTLGTHFREDKRSGLATMYHNLRNSVNGVRFVAFINKKHVFQCHEQTF